MQIIQIIQNPELFRIKKPGGPWLFDIRSVMNSECRIELLILYLFFVRQKPGALRSDFRAFLQAVLKYEKKVINCKCVI